MPKRRTKGQQLPTLPKSGDLFQASFDLLKQDQFVTSLGVQFEHYQAMPSPIGLKERGDYRRPDSLDTISSNGMLYKKVGCLTATMVSNSTRQRTGEGGLLDDSTSRLILPRFYDKGENAAEGERIYMAPGDRVYIADKDADVLVSDYQRMEFEPSRDNVARFPIVKLNFITDSLGQEFKENVDFCITKDGNIRWLPGGNNPGIDPETKQGRIYSVRFLYRAYWYIVSLPNEVRITNTSDGDVRKPDRMAYSAMIQREYVYHTQNRPAPENAQEVLPSRTNKPLRDNLDPNHTKVKVNVNDFSEEEQE